MTNKFEDSWDEDDGDDFGGKVDKKTIARRTRRASKQQTHKLLEAVKGSKWNTVNASENSDA